MGVGEDMLTFLLCSLPLLEANSGWECRVREVS